MHELTFSVGKVTTTSNTTEEPMRGFNRKTHRHRDILNGSCRLMAAKSTGFTAITAATQSVRELLGFISTNHKELCVRWGVSEKELEETPESTATTAYGAYIMGIGFQGDTVKLTMALAPCLLGYGEAGLWLIEESKRPDSWVIMDVKLNPYVSWIKEFSGESYQNEVKAGLGMPWVYLVEFSTDVFDAQQQQLKVLGRQCLSLRRDLRSWSGSGRSAL